MKSQDDLMEYEELEKLVINWGEAKGLMSPDNCRNQLLKFYEEAGELARAELKNDAELIVDALGDVMVTLILYSKQKGYPLMSCLQSAWYEIKDRTGKLENGTFIKG